MFYEKAQFKELKKKTSRDCLICFGKCGGHKGIDEKDPISILIADSGIFLERAKGEDAIVLMEHITAFKQTDNTITVKTTDESAKKLVLYIRSQNHRDKGCALLEKYATHLKK
ncbi:MAG: hypothetical protein IJN31_04935 [Peptococcaceae bacterium]|nr:hypothetical protein [Peptococcaceae bacterium]